LSWQLWWLINTQPQFSAKPRPIIPLWRLDPFAERPAMTQTELDAQVNALWDMATDDEELQQ